MLNQKPPLLSSHEPGELHIHIAAECFSQTSIESVENLAADFGQNLDIQPMPNFSELLGKEIDRTMASMGCSSLDELDRNHVVLPGDRYAAAPFDPRNR